MSHLQNVSTSCNSIITRPTTRITWPTTHDSSIKSLPIDMVRSIIAFLSKYEDFVHLGLVNKQFTLLFSDTHTLNFILNKFFPEFCKDLKYDAPPNVYKQIKNVKNNMQQVGKFRFQMLIKKFTGDGPSAFHGDKLISNLWSDNGLIRIVSLRTSKLLQTLSGHQGSITCLASYGENQIISGSWDCTIKIWDLRTGELLQTLSGHQSLITCLATYGENQIISGSGGDATIKIWDLRTGELLRTLSGHIRLVQCLAILGENELISGSNDGTIKIWDLRTGQFQRNLNEFPCLAQHLAICENEIISGSSNGDIQIWDLRGGFPLRTLYGHKYCITNLTICMDGKLISSSRDDTIKIWDLKSRKLLQTIGPNVYSAGIRKIKFCGGKLFTVTYSGEVGAFDFNFPSLSPYLKQTLEENLEILGKMAHAEYMQQPQVLEALTGDLHPDFKERLRQHSFKLNASFSCSAEVILRVQTEVCLEALLVAIYGEDGDRVSKLLHQLVWIDHENSKIYGLLWEICSKPDFDRWGEYAFHNQYGHSASLLEKEQAVVAFKKVLKDRWGEDLFLLLADLGIVTEQHYSEQLQCRPDDLPKRGISSPADLQALFNSPDLQYLQITPEENTKDPLELQKSVRNQQATVYAFLNNLLMAAQQKSEETNACLVRHDESGNVRDASNPWPDFEEKLTYTLASLSTQGLTHQKLLDRFSPEFYAGHVKELNALIDEFRCLEQGTQMLRLHAYIHQWGIHQKWIKLKEENKIESLADLLKTAHAPHDIFRMG